MLYPRVDVVDYLFIFRLSFFVWQINTYIYLLTYLLLWKMLGSPKLRKHSGSSRVYDGHQMKILGELVESCEWKGVFTIIRLLVIRSDKDFGLLGRDILASNCIHHTTLHKSPDDKKVPMTPKYLQPIKHIKASTFSFETRRERCVLCC